jgi:hypothetical protein
LAQQQQQLSGKQPPPAASSGKKGAAKRGKDSHLSQVRFLSWGPIKRKNLISYVRKFSFGNLLFENFFYTMVHINFADTIVHLWLNLREQLQNFCFHTSILFIINIS